MHKLLLVLAVAAMTLSGCASDDSGSHDHPDETDGAQHHHEAEPQMVTVTMQNNLFAPDNLTIYVGDMVHFTTLDLQRHNVVSSTPGQEFRSPDVSSLNLPMVLPNTYERTFTVAGAVDYLCEYHTGMVGTIRVLDHNETADHHA